MFQGTFHFFKFQRTLALSERKLNKYFSITEVYAEKWMQHINHDHDFELAESDDTFFVVLHPSAGFRWWGPGAQT